MVKPKKTIEAVEIEVYKRSHIPHRMNLLITFRDRMYPLTDNQRQHIRDLFRCSKDMSVMMMRFLLGEMGVYIPKGCNEMKYGKPKNHCGNLEQRTITDDGMVDLITDVLKFGNRAIAHIKTGDVDHTFRDREGDKRLVEAIDYIERKVIELIYGSEAEYREVMAMCDNNMHRGRFELEALLPDIPPTHCATTST